jgi:hypothetical protein
MDAKAFTGIVMAVAAFLATTGVLAQPRGESTWNVVLNGRALHIDAAADWNEANWGLGLEREFDSGGRWVKVALANGFKDSLGEPSYMAGGGLKRRFRPMSNELYVDLGAVAFLMTREDVNGSRPFPGILPAMTVGSRRVALNLTYLPQHAVNELTRANKRDPSMNGILFLQIKLNAAMFGFLGR